VPGKLAFRVLANQAFASFFAAAGHGGAAVFGGGAGPEAVLAFPRPFRGSVGGLHKAFSVSNMWNVRHYQRRFVSQQGT
jgi:hypothetical protein